MAKRPFNSSTHSTEELWKRTVDEDTESVADFLLRIENVRRYRFYRFQVHRWLAEMLMAYIGFNWMLREEAINSHLPGLQTTLRMLYEDPADKLHRVVQQYLAKSPKVHVRVLLRLCRVRCHTPGSISLHTEAMASSQL